MVVSRVPAPGQLPCSCLMLPALGAPLHWDKGAGVSL